MVFGRKKRQVEGATKTAESTAEYRFSITTSKKYADAGTTSTVKFQLIGEDGNAATEWHTISNMWKGGFSKGRSDHCTITAIDVGVPAILNIKLIGDDMWMCDEVVVTVGNDATKFLIYDYIKDYIEVAPGQATLPQNVTAPQLRSIRKSEVENNKVSFEWIPPPTKNEMGYGLPRFVNALTYDDLPPIFKRYEVRAKNFADKKVEAFLTTSVQGIFHPIHNLDSYHQIYKLLSSSHSTNFLDGWQTDENQGWQILNSVSPLTFSRCTKIPSYFMVTDDDVKDFLPHGKSLQSEIEAGKMYIIDFSETFGDLTPRQTDKGTFYCPPCLALCYVNPKDDFVPIAIQLVSDNRDDSRDWLFTPADDHGHICDWLLAKMYLRCAVGNKHEWIYHFLYTHQVTEPFAVSLFRCLPRCHPIYKLLRPHLRTVSAINTNARGSLLGPTDLPSKAIAVAAAPMAIMYYEKFRMDDINIPKVLKNQGIDVEKIPQYYYGRDALGIWKIIEDYVSSIVSVYYKSTQDVQDDYELQGWAQDVTVEGLGWHDNNNRGMPRKFETVDQLIEICTILIATSSMQHAAVNFGQFENYKFAPNSPLLMRLPAHKRGEGTMERVMKSLPLLRQAVIACAVTFTLSSFAPNDVYLGTFNKQLFVDEEALACQDKFRADLERLDEVIHDRNKMLFRKYEHLAPSEVPNDIAI